jgi:pyruvate/2-oxoglutarate dehydrogenase complex dihydrolipoamide acyltransferase (E2) component
MKKQVNDTYNTPWRKAATAIYKKSVDGRVYGTFEVEMDPVLGYIKEQKKKGVRITITQIVIAAIGRAIALDIPDVNVYISKGNIYTRDNVGIFTSVSKEGKKEMGGFVLRDIEHKTIFDISKEMNDRVEKTRVNENENRELKKKNLAASIPWPFLNWIMNFARWWTTVMGNELKTLKHDSFGSGLLTNIGTHDLQFGFPALLPIANIPFSIAIGRIEAKPVVRDGEIVIRQIMPAAAALDHRIFDGSQGGILATAVRGYLMDPKCLETPARELINKA